MGLFSGEVTEKVVDFQVPGRGLDFVWSRRYRSSGTEDSALGNDWDFSYNLYVEGPDNPSLPAVPNAIVHMGNARPVQFVWNNGNASVTNYRADGWEAELSKTSTGVLSLRFGNGVVWTFVNGGAGDRKISTIADRYGNTLSFAYHATSGRLLTITDTLSRVYNIAYDGNGSISSLTESAGLGRTIGYAHYGASEAGGNLYDLKSVTYPAITGTSTGNDFPSGRSLSYTYDKTVNSALRGNLLTIVDGRGNTALTAAYDSSDRTTSQTWGSGAGAALVTVSYPAAPSG